MGRYYYGDIEGKFWFGVQSSNDINNLINIKGIQNYEWKVCYCKVEVNHTYCMECYSTKEEHIEAIIQEDEDDYDDKCLYNERNYINYYIHKSIHYDQLVHNMNKLKEKIPEKIIEHFNKIERTDQILDASSGVFDGISLKDCDLEILARYSLGYQIEYCLQLKKTCLVECEM